MTAVRRERFVWGWLRLALGFAQLAATGLSFGSLITIGLRPLTVGFALLATTLTLISLLIYKRRSSPNSAHTDTLKRPRP